MEISEEQVRSLAACLQKVSEHVDQDMCSLADKGQELRRLMNDIDIARNDLAMITRQAQEGPS